MKVVVSKHSGLNNGVARMLGDAKALPEFEMTTLMTLVHSAF